MTKREFIVLTCAFLGGYYLIADLMPQFLLLPSLMQDFESVLYPIADFFVTQFALITALIGLLADAHPISKIVVPTESEGSMKSRLDFAEAVLGAFGIFLMTNALPSIHQALFYSFGSAWVNFFGSSGILTSFGAIMAYIYPYLLEAILFIIMGLWLIKGARKLAQKITSESGATEMSL